MAKDRQARPRAETPKGFRDYFGADVTERAAMLERIAGVYRLYGFDALETPAVENENALGAHLPDVDQPNKGIFAWGKDDDKLALRYDLTAPLARVFAQHRNDLPTPYRRYAMGPVWRNEKPGPGRFRQFYQCDADTVGAASGAADAEMCALICDALEAAGIERGDYVVRVNSRKVLNGVWNLVFGWQESEDSQLEAVYKTVHQREGILRAIDKFDKFGRAGVFALLTGGRKDESGDFTKGSGLSPEQAEMVLSILEARRATNKSTIEHLDGLVGSTVNGREGVAELRQIADLLRSQGYAEDQVVIDPSVVRGLDYYTGPVFEAELTFEIADEKGRPQRFGSVAGGGRYDDLVKRFTGQEVPATGISIGVDRLLAALRAKAKTTAAAAEPLVVVTVMDRDRMADYQRLAARLRGMKVGNSKVRAEVYLGNPKNFGNQLKYADRRGAAVAIIQGGDEAARGVVQVKDLVLGARIAEAATHEEWKSQPAQVEVPLDQLEAAIRRCLGA